MKLTTGCEYALLAMLTLAKAFKSKQLITTKKISKTNAIPREYLEKIVAELSRAGLVNAHKGPNGGLELAKDPDSISIANIVREIDGALAPVKSVSKHNYEPTPIEKSKSLTLLFRRIRDIQYKILSKTTLADLVSI